MFKSLFLKLKLMASNIWDFIKPVVLAFLSDVGSDLAEVALYAVKTLAESDLSDEEKRDQAVELIKAKLKEKGKEAKDSLINLAIEIAVQKLKSEE